MLYAEDVVFHVCPALRSSVRLTTLTKHDVFGREGCTAIVEVQQASTDTCTFFHQAYVLCAGEVVFHGDSKDQALAMLGASGMPCPPLYHPIEQYMRLIDPSFEVSHCFPCNLMLDFHIVIFKHVL